MARATQSKRAGSRPLYELRARKRGPGDLLLEVWQLPSSATPELREPYYVGGLSGGNLALVDHRVLRQLRGAGIDAGSVRTGASQSWAMEDEHLALRLALAFRALAPMRNRMHMRAVAEGIDEMAPEEAAYWLGMSMHRRHPRRVLMALRALLVTPS
jgi:hypothetical protein